jgi:hypothetical protein
VRRHEPCKANEDFKVTTRETGRTRGPKQQGQGCQNVQHVIYNALLQIMRDGPGLRFSSHVNDKSLLCSCGPFGCKRQHTSSGKLLREGK